MTTQITTAQINQNCSTCAVYMCGSKKTCAAVKSWTCAAVNSWTCAAVNSWTCLAV